MQTATSTECYVSHPLRQGSSKLIALLSVAAIGATAYWIANRYVVANSNDSKQVDAIVHEVQRSDFVLAVTERGEINSAGVTEIRSAVKTKNTPGVAILRIIPEGSKIRKGDFLVELDSSALEAERTSQQILCNAAQALVIEASNVYETAVISKQEYIEGTYVNERQTIESEVFVAEENLSRAQEYYEYSKKLAVKDFVNDLQLEADKFAVEKYRKELEAANTKLKVLDEFTRAKTVKQLESDILIAKAKWEANKSSYQLELDKLKDIEDQIAKCTIVAPRDGTVIYAHERDHRGNNDFIVEEGAIIRERQAIFKIPDSSAMQVEITINESLIQFVEKGLPVSVTPVGMGDMTLSGKVDRVNQFAEPTGWRKANVKEYKAYVAIEDAPLSLRSGLTASVTIECASVKDAIKVPVQAVYAHGDKFYCMLRDGGDWKAQEVLCGPTNDKFYVIEGGLQEQDRVALNPRRLLSVVELPELAPEQQQRAVPQPKPANKTIAKQSDDKKATSSTTTGG
ncbi:MAG: HlyD family efflux transporter periplasmic adaptor subunit [Planctomycetota bacterium]